MCPFFSVSYVLINIWQWGVGGIRDCGLWGLGTGDWVGTGDFGTLGLGTGDWYIQYRDWGLAQI